MWWLRTDFRLVRSHMRDGAVDWQEQNRSKQILAQSLEWFKQKEISTSNIPETIPTPQCVCLRFSVDVSHSVSVRSGIMTTPAQLNPTLEREFYKNNPRAAASMSPGRNALTENGTLGRVHFSKGSTLLQSNNNHHCYTYNTTNKTATVTEEPESNDNERAQISQKKNSPKKHLDSKAPLRNVTNKILFQTFNHEPWDATTKLHHHKALYTTVQFWEAQESHHSCICLIKFFWIYFKMWFILEKQNWIFWSHYSSRDIIIN